MDNLLLTIRAEVLASAFETNGLSGLADLMRRCAAIMGE